MWVPFVLLVPVCDVCVPFTALAVGSVEAARSPHLPVDPASDTVVTLALWRTGAVVLGVGVTGPSLPVCPLVTTIMSLLSNSGFTSYFLFLIKRHKVRTTGPTQVVPVPRLITYFWYYLLDQNSVRVRTRNNTGRVESLFDLSPSLISLSLFCVQGMRVLAQVVLAYLVFGTFCFPGITSSTVPPGIVSKYPDPGRAPKGALSCGVQVVGGGGASRASSRGFLAQLVGTRAPSAFFIFGHTLSEGRGGGCFPCPTGSLTARVLVNGVSAPPRVSTPYSSSVSRHLGLRVRSYPGSSQQDPVQRS